MGIPKKKTFETKSAYKKRLEEAGYSASQVASATDSSSGWSGWGGGDSGASSSCSSDGGGGGGCD